MLELFYTCVANLAKIMNQREITLPDEQHHYIEKDDYNRCIYHKRELDSAERTIVVMRDAEKLIELCDKTGNLDDTSEYQLLIRFLKERTIIDSDGVEAIPSLLRRRYHVDKIPTHGKNRTRFHFGFKIAALGCPFFVQQLF